MRESLKKNTWDSSSSPSHSSAIPACFHSQKLWGLLFLALEPWAGECNLRLGPVTLQEGPPQMKYSSLFLNAHLGVGPVCSVTLPLLPVSIWLLLYTLSFRSFVQLNFRWFLMIAVLVVILNVALGEGKHSIYLFCHLEWKLFSICL